LPRRATVLCHCNLHCNPAPFIASNSECLPSISLCKGIWKLWESDPTWLQFILWPFALTVLFPVLRITAHASHASVYTVCKQQQTTSKYIIYLFHNLVNPIVLIVVVVCHNLIPPPNLYLSY